MAVSFRLPDVGEGVAEAEIVRWLVQVGDEVATDQPVCEVQTDKAVVELPAPASGHMAELKWKEGDVVPVGEVLYVIDTGKSQMKAVGKAPAKGSKGNEVVHTDTKPATISTTQAVVSLDPQTKPNQRALAAPSTRRLARELGVELSMVVGTGTNGRVMDEDVRRFAAGGQVPISTMSTPIAHSFTTDIAEVVETPLTPTRRVIAERLLFSVTHKPHATHFDELDVTGLVEWRKQRVAEQVNQSDLPRLTYASILLKCIAMTLNKHLQFNAHFDEEQQKIRTFSSISLGMATDTPKGLLVPVIHQLEKKSMDQIAMEVAQLTELGRTGKLAPQQLKGSTFTISNAGSLGGMWATPIINPPEIAILAIHPIEQKPVVVNGELSVGWRMNVSLSFDHRVLDGAEAIRFTKTLGEYTADLGRMLREMV